MMNKKQEAMVRHVRRHDFEERHRANKLMAKHRRGEKA